MNSPNAPRHVRARTGRQDATAGLAFSGLLIAVSFVALIIPLAVYHAAQVAAALRLRTAILLLCAVVGLCLLLGVLAGLEAFLLGGMVGLVWTPLLALALHERSRSRTKVLSVVLFAMPLMLILAFAIRAPIVSDMGAALDSRVEEALARTSPLAVPSPGVAAPGVAAPGVAAPGVAAPGVAAPGKEATPPAADFATTARDGVAKFKETREFEIISKAAALGPWQRLLWFVFGEGAQILFLIVGISLGNLFFLDVAFAQVERVRAAARYVCANRGQFPPALAQSVALLRYPRKSTSTGEPIASSSDVEGAVEDPVAADQDTPNEEGEKHAGPIIGHEKQRDLTANGSAATPLWKRLLAPRVVRGTARLWGYVFRFAEGPLARGWELKYFSLPLPVALCAVALLASLGFLASDADGLYASLASSPWLPAAGLGAVVAFVLLCILAFQGALVVSMRLPPLVLLVGLLVLLFVGAAGFLTPLVLIAIAGGLGLLDYAYDFRGRQPQSSVLVKA